MGSERKSAPLLGISLPTRSPAGVPHLLALVGACSKAAADHDAAVIMLAGRHGPTAQLQTVQLVPMVMELAPAIPVAPLFIAPVWPPHLLLEQLLSLSLFGEHFGNRLVPVLATGTDQPVAETGQHPGPMRAQAMDFVLDLLLDAGFVPWVAAESGQALRRAARAGGWVSNAIYDDSELKAQLDVVGSVAVRAVRRDIVCHVDGTFARDRVDRLLAEGYRTGMSARHVIAGDIDDCSGAILRLADRGFTHVLLRPMESDPEVAAGTIDAIFDAMRK